MKRVLIIIGTIVLILASIIFWRNIFGFYHEVVRRDVVDLGGYGYENVHDMAFDQDGNLYVLSVSKKEIKTEDGFGKLSFMVLISKINEKKRVEWSLPIKEINGSELTELHTLNLSELTVSEDEEVFFLVQYQEHKDSVYKRNDFIIRVYDQGKKVKAADISKEDLVAKKLLFHDDMLYTFYNSTYSNKNLNTLKYETRNAIDLDFVANQIVTVNAYSKINEMVIHEGNIFFLTSLTDHTTTDSVLTSFRLHKLSIEDHQYKLLDSTLKSTSYAFTAINDSRIIYTTVNDLWRIDKININGYDFKHGKLLTKQEIELQNTDNRLRGIAVDDRNHIFVYGSKDAPNFVDSYYEEYDLDSELKSEYAASIGGVDSIHKFESNDKGDVAFVISTDRVRDMDYFYSSGNLYADHIIRYRKLK
ncbi:hypothetical protein [Haloplasma contractile]|uniref:Uncharacterized protein n=1 Tax=Haloplasma contractile SSD-17B TaxID=1033810 RepID=F7PVX4_9MOLU|nr:hypothetical protein [Haloplasma contractile]ERJ12702.1 hypothetical protein HLPCO_001042 [Haloplasma contractile SSD-17B]